MTLEITLNEVLRKIGRNMVLFQQLEHLLKVLVANSSISGYASELELKEEIKRANINKQTMGHLMGQYIDIFDPESQEVSEGPEDLKEVFTSFKFHIGRDSTYYDTKKKALAKLVEDRNELIHHLLPQFDPDSIESCVQIGEKLDAQRDNIHREIRNVKSLIDALNEGMKLFESFFNSPLLLEKIEFDFRQSYLIQLLNNITEETARPDGWTPIDRAEHLIRQRVPEEIASLKEHFGYKSLKAFILAAKIFDVYEEPTKKGIRILYRKRTDSELSNA